MAKLKNKPVMLIILDGWGIAPDAPGNAITKAKKTTTIGGIRPYFDALNEVRFNRRYINHHLQKEFTERMVH